MVVPTIDMQRLIRRFSNKSIHSSSLLAYDKINCNDPKDKLIVYLHGILGSKRNWRTPCNVWVKKHPMYGAISIDHRGHGDSYNLSERNLPDTIENCAIDINNTLNIASENSINPPSIIIAHSFGGKVALKYLEHRLKLGLSIPEHTWIVDCIPGKYNGHVENGEESVINVINTVTDPSFPKTFNTRDEIINYLINNAGFSKAIAFWLATNITMNETKKFTWSLNFNIIKSLFNDFCSLDMFPFLMNYNGRGKIHFLQAGRNQAWNNNIIIDQINQIKLNNNNNIKFHIMPDVGHWVSNT